jgi:protein O-GlcNAc transferase
MGICVDCMGICVGGAGIAALGANYIDYILADAFVIPEAYFSYYDEKVVWLPDCYQPNDRKRAVAEIPSRAEVGLPENKIVLVSFNDGYKILPETFQIWMRILAKIPETVLWLVGSSPQLIENLRNEANICGVNVERLIFADKKTYPEHLARLSLADLFLDTFPYCAHTNMSDALWVGVPAITRAGQSFVSRSGSLLHAVGLPELITDNLTDYESLALELAQNPAKLAELKNRLKENRNTCALFDTPRYVRNLENAYEMMYERAKQGLPPVHLKV